MKRMMYFKPACSDIAESGGRVGVFGVDTVEVGILGAVSIEADGVLTVVSGAQAVNANKKTIGHAKEWHLLTIAA
jgi:hypothetical protein